jgi:hypothetical protein
MTTAWLPLLLVLINDARGSNLLSTFRYYPPHSEAPLQQFYEPPPSYEQFMKDMYSPPSYQSTMLGTYWEPRSFNGSISCELWPISWYAGADADAQIPLSERPSKSSSASTAFPEPADSSDEPSPLTSSNRSISAKKENQKSRSLHPTQPHPKTSSGQRTNAQKPWIMVPQRKNGSPAAASPGPISTQKDLNPNSKRSRDKPRAEQKLPRKLQEGERIIAPIEKATSTAKTHVTRKQPAEDTDFKPKDQSALHLKAVPKKEPHTPDKNTKRTRPADDTVILHSVYKKGVSTLGVTVFLQNKVVPIKFEAKGSLSQDLLDELQKAIFHYYVDTNQQRREFFVAALRETMKDWNNEKKEIFVELMQKIGACLDSADDE